MFDFQFIQSYLDRIEPVLAWAANIGGKLTVCMIILCAFMLATSVLLGFLFALRMACNAFLAYFGFDFAKQALTRDRIKFATAIADTRDAAREQVEWAIKWHVLDTRFELKLLQYLANVLKPKTAALPAPRN